MQLQNPPLVFPTAFCCNCGNTDCALEIQDTRVTRFFGIGGEETTFHLPLPICAGCRRTLRRRPPGFFSRLLTLGLLVVGWMLVLIAFGASLRLPTMVVDHRFIVSAVLGLICAVIFYRLRRARSPRTSFHQPVRIRDARVRIVPGDSEPGSVSYLKLAFTNSDYLNLFVNANGEAINSGSLAVVPG